MKFLGRWSLPIGMRILATPATKTMRTVSFSIASFLFLVFWFVVLAVAIGIPVSTPLRGNAFNLSFFVADAFFTVLPPLLVAIALILVDFFLHRKTPIFLLAGKLPIIFFLLFLLSIGGIVNIYLLIMCKALKIGAG